mmetsp:Transcript_19504/g.54841  ORF Transcript_19504/g.54841 Transcript_19504/m.54841 type:complete len:426 (+) Transcript_19504:1411-2688(+)
MTPLGDNGRFLASSEFLHFAKLQRTFNQTCESVLATTSQLRLVTLVLFQVDANRCPNRAGSTEPKDDAGSVREEEAETLVGTVRLVKRVVIVEYVGVLEGVAMLLGDGLQEATVGQVRLRLLEMFHKALSGGGVDVLVVVAAVEVASVTLPEVRHDIGDGDELAHLAILVLKCQDRKPRDHRPESVLLPHVVAASTEALLTTDNGVAPLRLKVVHDVSKKLPPRWHFVHCTPQRPTNVIHRRGRRHGPGDGAQSLGKVRDGILSVLRNDGQGVRGGYKEVPPQDHVAVTVAVRGRPKVVLGVGVLQHSLHELWRVRQVGVGVTTPKVGQRNLARHTVLARTQLFHQDPHRVGPRDTAHGVEENVKVLPGQQLADGVEVEHLLESHQVVGNAIDYLHREFAPAVHVKSGLPKFREVDRRELSNLVR